MKRFIQRIKTRERECYEKEINELKAKNELLEKEVKELRLLKKNSKVEKTSPEKRARCAYELFEHVDYLSHCFEFERWNEKNDDIFVVLKRIKPGVCPVDRETEQHTANAYLIVKKDNTVYIGSYARTTIEVNGKTYKTRLVGNIDVDY